MAITDAKVVIFALAVVLPLRAGTCFAQQARPRARDLGIPFEGTPGPSMRSPT